MGKIPWRREYYQPQYSYLGIPWTEEPVWLQSVESGRSQRVGHNWLTTSVGMGRSSGAGNSNLLLYSCLEIPWAEEPGGLQSMGSQRVGHNWATKPSPLLLCWPLGWSWEYNSSRESPQMRCYKNGDVVKGKGLMSQEGWGGCSWGIATYSIHTLPCPKQFYYRETVSLVWKKLQLKPFSVILGGSEELLYHSPLSISVEKNSWTAKW